MLSAPNAADTLLGSADTARELGVSETYIRELANSGRLPCIRTRGGHRFFRLDDVRGFQRERARRGRNTRKQTAAAAI